MITNRHVPRLAAVLMALAVLACTIATGFSGSLAIDAGVTMEYESKLFDTSEVLEVNILMDAAEWEAMLASAMAEEYVTCDVEIAGQTFYRVGVRPKGNTSLSSIANDPNTDRYSFKLEFDQYVEGQTCFGLDKLILNNNYADATNMKEALIYDMFAHVGADASLYNYARVSVNGEYWGVYLALEAVEESFMLRNYGAEDGELYKPDFMNMGGRGGSSADGEAWGRRGEVGGMRPAQGQMPEGFNAEEFNAEDFDASGIRDRLADFMGGGFGGMMGGSGANLNYADDSLDSYAAIWEGEVTNTGDADHKRVVTALKAISEGVDLERYMDTENLVKYAAVHIFSENSDSLSGSMAHNYYLYESGGRLNLLPWDYNLALGGMGSSADGTVNGPIDDAWSGTKFFDTLMADEVYHAAYYDAMAQVVDYIQNGGFEAFYTRTRALIDELVATDPNAFYTFDEYEAALATLYEVVTLRGQSIAGQLAGDDAIIDASHLDLSVMGTMSMGGGMRPAQGQMPEGFDPSQFGGEMPTEGESQAQSGIRPSQGAFGQAAPAASGSGQTLLLCGVSTGVMLAAFLFACFYRRRPWKR